MSATYVEIELMISFNELNFPDYFSDPESPGDPFEIGMLCLYLDIDMDFAGVDEVYENTYEDSGETLVFYSNTSREVFIYLDLFRDKHDQLNMVTLGVRAKIENNSKVKNIIENLYYRSSTVCNYKIRFV